MKKILNIFVSFALIISIFSYNRMLIMSNNQTTEENYIEIVEGETLNLIDYFNPFNTGNFDNIKLSTENTWYVNIIDGKLIGINNGTVRIYATLDNTTKSCLVRVIMPILGIDLDKLSSIMKVGESKELNATTWPDAINNRFLMWSSSNPKVATVENGIITAKSAGRTTITVSTTNGISNTHEIAVQDNISKLPFNDVNSNKWYYPYVIESCEQGFMTGTSETTFEPDATMTRGMVVSVLYRMAYSPNLKFEKKFKDVDEKKYCAVPITWATNNNIISGYSGNKQGYFGPNDNIKRQDLVLILYRYFKSKEGSIYTDVHAILDDFKDEQKISDYAKDAMEWAVAANILSGTKEGYLNPQKDVTRAECAKMLLNFYKLLMPTNEDEPALPNFPYQLYVPLYHQELIGYFFPVSDEKSPEALELNKQLDIPIGNSLRFGDYEDYGEVYYAFSDE